MKVKYFPDTDTALVEFTQAKLHETKAYRDEGIPGRSCGACLIKRSNIWEGRACRD
jgi:hypothetical protein